MSKQSSKSISPSPSSSLRKYWEIRHTIIISEVRRRIKDVDLAMNECTINFVVSSGSSSLLFVKGIIVMQRRNSAVQTAHGNRTESTKEWTVIWADGIFQFYICHYHKPQDERVCTQLVSTVSLTSIIYQGDIYYTRYIWIWSSHTHTSLLNIHLTLSGSFS